jgi:F-type H+-transporting ATPase subunit b
MRGPLFGPLVLFSCLIFLSAALPSVRAADTPQKPKINVSYHENGQHKEKSYDLNNQAHVDEVVGRLRNGEIETLAQDKPPALLDLRWDLGLWTLIVFLLLFLVLKKMAWKPMLEGLQKREDRINSAIDDARRAREEAERLRGEFAAEMNKAQEKVREVMDEARRDAQHTKDDMIAQARNEIQGERERLRREINTARDQALKDLWEQSARLATLISSKAIKRELSIDDHRRLFDEALTELGQANVGGRDRLI